MTRRLVIVESPTKARTLRRFLGGDYIVESSVGHIRDLPASAAEIPEELKKNAWARLGVNVENDFEPLYIISPEKKKVIRELKKRLKEVDELLLATDEDREGEAISWHLTETLQPKIPTRRMVFHEITKEAILDALDHTREIDVDLVRAQETRRIIDRLYGYEVSPVLWRKIAPRLSAGRVQSVAIRMLVDREHARMRFRPARYWDLSATLRTTDGQTFPARLVQVEGRRLATGKDFDPDTGKLARAEAWLLEAEEAASLRAALLEAAGRGETLRVVETQEKAFTRSPAPPFTTSTLQQEGGRKLGFDARRTMRAAQRLYENGHITYMRTDSVALSPEALRASRKAVETLYGAEYLPSAPRTFANKVKNAQEAHEAIRPAGESFAAPADLDGKVGPDELRLYDLIWKRTMASQMEQARGRRMVVRVGAEVDGRELVFQANGNVIDFPGFLRAYVEGSDDPDAALADREVVLPPVAEGHKVAVAELAAEDHVTQPPARLTEASLVKALEESGIGRPSTYASIIDTIQRREYTFKKGSALVPTFTAFAVVRLMTEHLSELVDLNFTARMEDRLDEISRGEADWLPYLRRFYFGDDGEGLRPLLDAKTEDIDPRAVCSIPLGEGRGLDGVVVRVGRYGPYLQRGDDTAPIPDGTCPDELVADLVGELFERAARGPEPLGEHPETGAPVYLKAGRFGPYVQLGDASEDGGKPKMASLLPGMKPEDVTLDLACQLLALPRNLGTDDAGVEILAFNGRYGPYIKRGEDTRSLSDSDNLLTVTRERALELLAQEKVRGRRRAAEPLAVFENVEALEGASLKVLAGRYGPYVSDGETNASLPRDMADPTKLTVEQAVQLILDRRAAGPSKKKKKKAARKKTATKTTTTVRKKAAKKKSSKKKAVRTKKTTSATSDD
jgi:DNA topoisomerase-1